VQSSPRIYIVFWGWASDPSGERPDLTTFLSSVGGTSWLSTVGQYGGGWMGELLAGTWADSAPVPAHPTDEQIQAEAAKADSHFGAGTSVNVQIVVATPTGHATSGFGTQWCAYHSAISVDGDGTYTNFPYMTDAGTACGAYTVDGPLDGVTIVESAELADTITDPLANGWYDSSGAEIADKCLFTKPGNITTPGGTFPVAPLWSNALGKCVL
jgi:hypothetical protein